MFERIGILVLIIKEKFVNFNAIKGHAMLTQFVLIFLVYANGENALAHASGASEKSSHQLRIKKSNAHYILMMSEDDSVCKPILIEYNRNISLDLWPKSSPRPYPWPVPPTLAMKWQVKQWEALPENDLINKQDYNVAEADLNDDGQSEVVVRWANWARSDDRFTALDVFPEKTKLSERLNEYDSSLHKKTVAMIVPDGYSLPKLKGKVQPTTLNDFDVIQFNGKYYVTGKTVIMDGIVEELNVPRWRVVSHVRFGKSTTPSQSKLDWTFDSVCYFRLTSTTK